MDQSPPTLTKGLESFVALLRNTQTASNIDVELYFAEFAKLSKKMMTITAHKHDLDTVSSHEKQLQAQKSEFVQEYPELEIIFEFALAFCTYAKKFCQQSQSGGGLIELEKRLASAQDDVSNFTKMEEATGGKTDTKTFLNKLLQDQKDRQSKIEALVDSDRQQCENYQKSWNEYDESVQAVFNKINEEVAAAAEGE